MWGRISTLFNGKVEALRRKIFEARMHTAHQKELEQARTQSKEQAKELEHVKAQLRQSNEKLLRSEQQQEEQQQKLSLSEKKQEKLSRTEKQQEKELEQFKEQLHQMQEELALRQESEAKRRKLSDTQKYVSALRTVPAEAKDRVLVHWQTDDVWSTAMVLPKPDQEQPAMLNVQCSLTGGDGVKLTTVARPESAELVTMRSAPQVLAKVLERKNLRKLARLLQMKEKDETEFRDHVANQTRNDVKAGLPIDQGWKIDAIHADLTRAAATVDQ